MIVLFAWRTACQVVIGALVVRAAALGFNLDQHVQDAALIAIEGVGVAVYATGVHWLETRTGDGPVARLCRGLARLLLLGAARPPVYAPRNKAVFTDDGQKLRPPLTQG